MARMYSRKKGKSGSKRPAVHTKPQWVRYTKKEVELLITRLAKEGASSSLIGLTLRDRYGIPDVRPIIGKRISKLLQEKKLSPEIPDDLLALIKKLVSVRKHLEENHKDMTANRGVQLTESKIKRLVHYYKLKKVLPLDWKYDVKSLEMYAQ